MIHVFDKMILKIKSLLCRRNNSDAEIFMRQRLYRIKLF